MVEKKSNGVSLEAATAKPRDLQREPVSRVQWVSRDLLKPNHYNPNVVAPPEIELLIVSILEDGWTQPIVVLPNYTIVDGFHRYTVSADPRLMARYGGMVPVVVVDFDPAHRMMSTVRHNRARGTHVVLPMAEIVRTIAADGVSHDDIMRGLGMEDEEVERLLDRAGMPEQVGRERQEFGNSWVPQG